MRSLPPDYEGPSVVPPLASSGKEITPSPSFAPLYKIPILTLQMLFIEVSLFGETIKASSPPA